MLVGLPVAQIVSSAILLTVASQCARNMIQTVELRRQYDASSLVPLGSKNDEISLLGAGSVGDRLRSMNRKELLTVFANSRAPTAEEVNEWFSSCGNDDDDTSKSKNESDIRYCEWDAMLLNNNGFFMSSVSSIITNGLFGGIFLPWRLVGAPKRSSGRWNGKAFRPNRPTSSPSSSMGFGINRFAGKDDNGSVANFKRHAFDYDLKPSRVFPGTANRDSLCLDYSRYQSLPISLWSSMKDEMRVVRVEQNEEESSTHVVMVGMGWMEWSGGPLNCSPFLIEGNVLVKQ